LRADGFQFQAYIVRVGSWASSGPKVSGPRWSSTGEFKNPPQTRTVSDIRTRKSVGENREPKPKPVDPKPADTRPEPDPLPSLIRIRTRQMKYRTHVLLHSLVIHCTLLVCTVFTFIHPTMFFQPQNTFVALYIYLVVYYPHLVKSSV
jgi:hypothetical protein